MLLKKAGMVVLAAGAGMVALTPAAFAGDAPSSASDNAGHSWGGDDHGGRDHGHGHWGHGSENHKSSSSCSNDVGAINATQSSGLLNVLGGAQTIVPVNACHILDDNSILNHNSLDVL